MNRNELQAIARIRLREAKALLNAGFPDGAYYLAGYSVECGLKACIAKGTKRYDFPDKERVNASFSHNFKKLVILADLEADRLAEANRYPEFREKWELVQQWSETSRYARYSADISAAMVDAAGNNKHGVLSWLKRHW